MYHRRGLLHFPVLTPGAPARRLTQASRTLDRDLLARFPEGYRHLGYLQTKAGFNVKLGLPGVRGPEVERLYREGAAWLGGSAKPGEPL